jgi:hypothetical protein
LKERGEEERRKKGKRRQRRKREGKKIGVKELQTIIFG